MSNAEVIKELREHFEQLNVKPMTISIIENFGKDPFLILISCLLSLRSKDTVTLPICIDLFSSIKTPQEFIDSPLSELEKIIKPIGFYRKKAQLLQEVSRVILEKFNGVVPKTREELSSIPGVGPKTVALVLGMAYDIPAVCVDVHVHRISNRLGLVKTKTPEETEAALEKIVPKNEWIKINWYLVALGQDVCVPVSPFCSRCLFQKVCAKAGVLKNR